MIYKNNKQSVRYFFQNKKKCILLQETKKTKQSKNKRKTKFKSKKKKKKADNP